MKIKTTTNNRKQKVVGVLALAILVIAGVAAYYFLLGPGAHRTNDSGMRDVNTVDYSPAKPSDKISESSKDLQAKDNNQSAGEQAKPQNLTVTISNASQDASNVYIRAITESATSGQCKATLTHGASTITKTAALSTQANYGICQGFNIPQSEFVESGSWKIHIDITSNDLSGSAETTLDITR